MAWFQRSALQSCPLLPQVNCRFLDDIFGLWPHSLCHFLQFIHLFNTHHPAIKVKYAQHATHRFSNHNRFFPRHKRTTHSPSHRSWSETSDPHALLHEVALTPSPRWWVLLNHKASGFTDSARRRRTFGGRPGPSSGSPLEHQGVGAALGRCWGRWGVLGLLLGGSLHGVGSIVCFNVFHVFIFTVCFLYIMMLLRPSTLVLPHLLHWRLLLGERTYECVNGFTMPHLSLFIYLFLYLFILSILHLSASTYLYPVCF